MWPNIRLSHIILTLSYPIHAISYECQVPGQKATGINFVIHWFKSTRNRTPDLPHERTALYRFGHSARCLLLHDEQISEQVKLGDGQPVACFPTSQLTTRNVNIIGLERLANKSSISGNNIFAPRVKKPNISGKTQLREVIRQSVERSMDHFRQSNYVIFIYNSPSCTTSFQILTRLSQFILECIHIKYL